VQLQNAEEFRKMRWKIKFSLMHCIIIDEAGHSRGRKQEKKLKDLGSNCCDSRLLSLRGSEKN